MKVRINKFRPGTASGFIFVTPYTFYVYEMIGQTGSLIMNQFGNPVWFQPLSSIYIQNANFRVQIFHEHTVLTMWQGTISGTQSSDFNLPDGDPEPGAYYEILDSHYNLIKRVYAQKGYTSDAREFTITERNTALFIAIKQIPADLTPYGGPMDGYIDDCSIQEIDLETGRLIFFWSALDHINPAGSMVPVSSAIARNNIWDCYHMNSVEEGPDHSLLISMRNMSAIYKIDKRSGSILWKLGGKKSDFLITSGAKFSWQHDARYRSWNIISLFDDACCASEDSWPDGQSHGLILQLDYYRMTATAVRKYFHDPALYVPSQGSVQELSNGNQFIGWGQEPYLSEYENEGNSITNPSLNFLYDMQFPNKNMTYRALKNNWIGLPLYPPSIAVVPECDYVNVYASWNGSTETVAWQVLAGPSPDTLSVVETSPRTGFETLTKVMQEGPYYQVKALDFYGKILGNSKLVNVLKQ
jgi:hypothetical protein